MFLGPYRCGIHSQKWIELAPRPWAPSPRRSVCTAVMGFRMKTWKQENTDLFSRPITELYRQDGPYFPKPIHSVYGYFFAMNLRIFFVRRPRRVTDCHFVSAASTLQQQSTAPLPLGSTTAASHFQPNDVFSTIDSNKICPCFHSKHSCLCMSSAERARQTVSSNNFLVLT